MGWDAPRGQFHPAIRPAFISGSRVLERCHLSQKGPRPRISLIAERLGVSLRKIRTPQRADRFDESEVVQPVPKGLMSKIAILRHQTLDGRLQICGRLGTPVFPPTLNSVCLFRRGEADAIGRGVERSAGMVSQPSGPG
jgi:hypothetical protein